MAIAHNDYEDCAVPAGARRGAWAMLVVMLGFTFFSASMWAGATLGAGLDFARFLFAVAIGNAILGAYTGVLGYIAGRSGLSTSLLMRRSFGAGASVLPTLLLVVTQVGWFGVGVAMFSQTFTTLLASHGLAINIWPVIGLSGLVMSSSAYWGIKALTIVSVVAVPAIAIFGAISLAITGATHAAAWATLWSYAPAADALLPMASAVAITVGSFISGGTCTPDFVRFANNGPSAAVCTLVAFFLGNSLMFLFGAVGGMFYQSNDISNVLVMQGLLLPGLLVLGLNIWTTNDNALYTSGLCLATLTRQPKRFMVLFNGLCGTLLSLWLNTHFVRYLLFLNAVIPPIGAIIITEYVIAARRQRRGAAAGGAEGAVADGVNAGGVRVQSRACVAWALGAACAFMPWGIAALNGMAAAALSYALMDIRRNHPRRLSAAGAD